MGATLGRAMCFSHAEQSFRLSEDNPSCSSVTSRSFSHFGLGRPASHLDMIYPHNETSFWRQEVNVTRPELTDGARADPVVRRDPH